MIYSINVEIINCNAAWLVLELNYLTYATIQNCTFGNWTFREVHNAFIKNCNNVIDKGASTSLKIFNSSAFLENIAIEHENISGIFDGILVYNSSLLHIEQSKFVNNTVAWGIIKMGKSSTLIMSKCTVSGNYAIHQAGAIFINESLVHPKDIYFNGNIAMNGGGAILVENISFLQINNCSFINNTVNRSYGAGGAILSMNNSLLDLYDSIFDHNNASQGGAIYQKTGKTKFNGCSFSRNSETAIVGMGSDISITDSIFINNLGKTKGGAVGMENSVLNVSSTSFVNNEQIFGASYSKPPALYTGGGAIYLSKSVGHISESKFCNNSASYWGGSVFVVYCSLSICNTIFENNLVGVYGGAMYINSSFVDIQTSIFENNSILNKVMGNGGGFFLDGNSTMKISNVLISKCEASLWGAIAANFTTIIMSDTFVTANTGSAVHLINGDSLEISNSEYLNNFSPDDGGAINCEGDCVVKIVNTTFSLNRAVGEGGAVNIAGMSVLNVHNCTFTDNIAYQGGAMGAMNSIFNISDGNFYNNTATEEGAIVFFFWQFSHDKLSHA